MLILSSDKGELSVHSYWLSVCILWGDAFWVKYSAFVLLSFHTGCVEPLPLSGGVGVFALFCLCMTVLSPASFLRGHALFDRLRWAVTLVLEGRSLVLLLFNSNDLFLPLLWLLVICLDFPLFFFFFGYPFLFPVLSCIFFCFVFVSPHLDAGASSWRVAVAWKMKVLTMHSSRGRLRSHPE